MTEKREEEIVNTEAQSIIKKVDKGNEMGWKVESSELDEVTTPGPTPQRTPTTSSMQSTQLSKDELSVANAHLMERIRPFLTNPMAGMAVTVFFFNDEQSQSRNIMTNESGHFSIRASLSFVPTHVRVLASEDLSAVKGVEVIKPTGVSLISDIDDTVKHSAITSGAKEIFRNVFVRELKDLTIEGVDEWYNNLAKLGVDIHYVSNAPWQLYPLLDRYFKMVGLPPGSFHLKQYSGMLQGIFEPTLERKKGNLEQILLDFPERKFILVGDSGEADLEVYTDLVLANPGRILGVFIRDITTPERTDFFEKSVDHLEQTPSRTRSTPDLVNRSDSAPNRPILPPRPSQIPPVPVSEAKSAEMEDLIDLSDDPPQKSPSESEKLLTGRTPPAIPSKPSSLRSVTNTADLADTRPEIRDPIKRKPAPPLPRRSVASDSGPSPNEPGSRRSSPGAGSDISERGAQTQLPIRARTAGPQSNNQTPGSKQPPAPPPPRRSNTGASAISSSSPRSDLNSRRTPERQPAFPTSTPSSRASSPSRRPVPPNILRSPASNPSLNRTNTNNSDVYPPSRASSVNSSAPPQPPLPNKREELWRRRWERASEILADRGVVLGSWRKGRDVQDVSLWLVKEALKGSSSPMKEKEREVERERGGASS
jgi:phosphatidate phosphatase APP1